jgi:hypothetical protein
MEAKQKPFLLYAMVDGLNYNQISSLIGVPRIQLSQCWKEYEPEREYLSRIRNLSKRKKIEAPFEDFESRYQEISASCNYYRIT